MKWHTLEQLAEMYKLFGLGPFDKGMITDPVVRNSIGNLSKASAILYTLKRSPTDNKIYRINEEYLPRLRRKGLI